MISILKHAAQNIFVLIAICISLTACKTAEPPPSELENGGVLLGLSGAEQSQTDYTLTLPDNTESLLIEMSGAEGVSLDVLDETGVSVGSCVLGVRCHVYSPSAAEYTVRMSATQAYAGVSLSASWGGPDSNALMNSVQNIDVSGAPGSVQLKSFNVGFTLNPIQLTAQGQFAAVEILNPSGGVIHECSSAANCQIPDIESGLYFVRLIGSAEFSEGALELTWGSAIEATLANGVTKKGIMGGVDSVHYESFYLPEGAEGFLVQHNEAPIHMEIVAPDGEIIGNCYPVCAANEVEPGLYYVKINFYGDEFDVHLTAAWAGGNIGTISNTELKRNLFGSNGDLFLDAFYVPEGANAISHSVSSYFNSEQILIDSQGEVISYCSAYDACAVDNIEPGVYFLQTKLLQHLANVSTSVAWAGPGISTLDNGGSYRGAFSVGGETQIHAVYLPEGVDSLAVTTAFYNPPFLIYDSSGYIFSECQDELCTVNSVLPGVYFIQVQAQQIQDYFLSVAWGGEHTSILQNGVHNGYYYGEELDRFLFSFYLPENTEAAFIAASFAQLGLGLYDAAGNQVFGTCMPYEGCILDHPQSGTYFASVSIHAEVESFAITAAWAGPDVASLQNGGYLGGFLGQKNDVFIQSIYVPEGASSLLVRSSQLYELNSILDSDFSYVSCLGGSSGYDECVIPIEPGPYFIRMEIPQDNDLFGVSAAWGGETVSTIENNKQVTIEEMGYEDFSIQSIYIPDDQAAILINWPDIEGEVALVSSEGYVLVCGDQGGAFYDSSVCLFDDLSAGEYFIRYQNSVAGADVSYSVAIVGENSTSLANGGSVALQAQEGDVVFQSFTVPEGAFSAMITTSYGQYGMDVIKPDGSVENCSVLDTCVVSYLEPGHYFVRVNVYDEYNSDFTLSAAWVGEGVASLTNNEPVVLLDVDFGDTVLHSFQLEEEASIDVQTSNAPHAVQLFDLYGNALMNCSAPCSFDSMFPGNYFIQLTVDAPADEMALTVSW